MSPRPRLVAVASFLTLGSVACAPTPPPARGPSELAPALAAPPAAVHPGRAAEPAAPPNPEDPLRATPPVTSDGWEPTGDRGQTFTLPNGMRVVVVERHGVPFVSTRLAIAFPAKANDAEADLRAWLLSGVFLQPPDAIGGISHGCTAHECTLRGRGTAEELGDVLAREAAAVQEDPPAAEAERRLSSGATAFATPAADVNANADRSAAVLLFGYDHPYSVPAAPPGPIALADLQRWRRDMFVPAAATLVLVGDVTVDQAKAVSARAFKDWSGARPERGHGAATPAVGHVVEGPHVLFTENDYVPTDYAMIVARAPAWGDPDLAAILVATETYEAPLPRSSPCMEMERHLSTSRRSVPWRLLPAASIVSLGGRFAQKTAVLSIAGVLRAIRESREADLTEEVLDRAKRLAIAAWRNHEGDAGTLAFMAQVALRAGALESAFGFEDKIAAVTVADVRRVAERYFADDQLRLVLIGKGADFAGVQDLGLGGVGQVDAHARARTASKK